MKTKQKNVNRIPVVNLLGYNRSEKEAVDTALIPLIESGVKFAVLRYEDSFMLQMYSLSEHEQYSILEEIKAEYDFSMGGYDETFFT